MALREADHESDGHRSQIDTVYANADRCLITTVISILHVVPAFVPAVRMGGPIHACFELAREQVRRGHRVTVMTTNHDADGVIDVPLGQVVEVDGIQAWYWPEERPRRAMFSRALARGLCDHIGRFDIVHIHMVFNWPATIAAYWARKRKIPYIIRPAGSLHPICIRKPYEKWTASLSSRVKKWTYFRTLAKTELSGAAAIHFTTEAEKLAALRFDIDAPSFVLPLGVSPLGGPAVPNVSFCDASRELRGKKLILFLSRLDPIKGLELLITACAELARTRDDFALGIAGDGESQYRESLKRLVCKSGLVDRTVFLGHISGLAKWHLLSETAVFALTSYHENFGLAVVEALAAGVPVIISRGVNLEVEVRTAGAGIVTGYSPTEIASDIKRLLDDEQLRMQMGGRARALATSEFLWPQVVARLDDEYLRILGRNS